MYRGNLTRIPAALEAVEKVYIPKACNHHFPSPAPLVEIAGRIANGLPLPPPWNWTPDEVSNWVGSELQFPQYKECFTKNRINGRTLLLVDASALPKMNITDFTHIKVITEAIRKLYGVEAEYFKRSISLPLRFPETCFLLHHLHSGPAYSDMTRLEFFRLVGIVEPPYKIMTHWDFVQPYHPDIPGKIVVGRPGMKTLCFRCIKERRY
ncbi:sterile alpha motif domain-containing protein 15-like [Schistocerca gregaria]|uniref:sterile alpha motif domain-containing protein 15-like n=1 Tax=Schistocerca gregaria TaxID=7010 RepID=UPI00211E4965|nr:sterile alpha motif domain-containing protein 15-like [Schistocerca gregaria]